MRAQGAPRYPDILMFVWLQEDAKRHCDVTSSIVLIVLASASTMSTIEFFDNTALVGVFLESKKRQNLLTLLGTLYSKPGWPGALPIP